jgi:tetratricopeptide (TPR) repeat protein
LFRRLIKQLGRPLVAALLLLIAGFGFYLAGIHVWAEYHYRRANQDLAAGRLSPGREHLKKCLSVWPNSGLTHLLAAQAQRRAGFLPAAEEHLHQAQRLLKRREGIVLERKLLAAQKGDIDEIEALRDQIDKNPKAEPLILEALTAGCLRLYRLGEAGYCIGRWLEIQPDNPAVYVARGGLQELIGSYRRAADDYRRAVELNEEDDSTRQKLISVLLNTSQFAEAQTHLQRLSQRQPDNPDTLVSLARVQSAQGHTEEAAQTLDEMLVQFPHHFAALAEQGQIALQLHQLDKAETCLRQAIELQPFDYVAHYNLSLCLRGQPHRQEEATEQEKQAKELKDGAARVREIVTRDLRERPDDPALLCEAGVIFLRAGNVKGGLGWLRSALRQDPNYRPAHKALVEHYERMGDTSRAGFHRRILEAAGSKGNPAR